MTNNQRQIEKEVNATAVKNRETALQNIPQGWERVTEGDSQNGDKSWKPNQNGFYATSANTPSNYFICLIREVQ